MVLAVAGLLCLWVSQSALQVCGPKCSTPAGWVAAPFSCVNGGEMRGRGAGMRPVLG